MQLTAVLALAPFLGIALAAPSPNAHQKFHHKRQEPLVTVTNLVIVTDVVTTTLYVQPGQVPAPSPSPEAGPAPVAPVPAPAESSGIVALQPPAPTPSTTTSIAAAQPSPPPQPQVPASPAPSPEAPAPSPDPQPQQPQQPSGGNTSGAPVGSTLTGATSEVPACSPFCTGDATFYPVGLGACGKTSTTSDYIVAFPSQVMGTDSSGDDLNKLCNKKVAITLIAGKAPIVATVVDKCGGCALDTSLDMSSGLFDALGGDQSVGRYTNMTWTWA